jgi:hypothetical protein
MQRAAGDAMVAVDSFVQAPDPDATCRLAAYRRGLAYADRKSWRAARAYYLRALPSETAAMRPDLRCGLAWRCGKTRDDAQEAWAYRAYLERAPDNPWPDQRVRVIGKVLAVFRPLSA